MRLSMMMLSLLLAASAGPRHTPASATKVTVKGWIYDAGGRALSGVQVTIDQQGQVAGPFLSRDGEYAAEVPGGRPLSNITYYYPGYEPGVVLNLSEKRSHDISKNPVQAG